MNSNYLGNSSQSFIPVPKFFYTRKIKSIDAFSNCNTHTKRYFTEKDLFSKLKELNFSRNQRNNDKLFEEYNTKRLVPKQHKEIKKFSSSLNPKDFGSKARIPEELHQFEKFNQYMEKINSQESSRERIDEMRNNINNVIDRLSTNYANYNFDKFSIKGRSEVGSQGSLNTIYNYKDPNSQTLNQLTTLNSLGSILRTKTKISYNNAETETEKFQQSIQDKMRNLNKNNFLKTNSVNLKKHSLPSFTSNYHETKIGFPNFEDKNTRSSEFLPFGKDMNSKHDFKTNSVMNVKTELDKSNAFAMGSKNNLILTEMKIDPRATEIHIPFRKRNFDEEMLICTDKY